MSRYDKLNHGTAHELLEFKAFQDFTGFFKTRLTCRQRQFLKCKQYTKASSKAWLQNAMF